MEKSVISSVSMHNGVPTLFVNNSEVAGAAYITYYTWNNDYESFAKKGYKLFSMPVFFAKRGINAVTGIPPFAEGVYENREPDFSIFDNDVEKILSVCPDAMIFPRVNMTLPKWWDDENPDELEDFGFFDIKRPCFSSDKWLEKTKELLKAFIEHVESMPYKNSIIGYQLAGGNTEEWISFDQKGSIGKRTYEAFEVYKNERSIEGTESDFYEFLSYVVATRICQLSKYAKELINYRLVVGAFYGYTLELPKRSNCHHALQTVLECKDVDFICSPVSYDCLRKTMRDHANMLPIDSLKLHGKLYFAENDTRTHLSGPPFDLEYYKSAIWKGPEEEITLQILKMHFSRALCHGHAFWWFDMWGKWYQTEGYMSFMEKALCISNESLKKSLKSNARVAVFVDERAYDVIPDENDVSQKVCYEFRRALGKTATPYDIYLITDFEEVKDNYDVHIFLVPSRTKMVDDAEKSLNAYLEINGDNYNISPAELREYFASRGVKPYFDVDAVVYENESYLFVHTCEEGTYSFEGNFVDAFTKEKITEINLKEGTSLLLEKV